jgi:hypothetical protein
MDSICVNQENLCGLEKALRNSFLRVPMCNRFSGRVASLLDFQGLGDRDFIFSSL